MFKVDVFVRSRRPFDQLQLARRSAHIVTTDPQRIAYVATAEDTILAKLEWYRAGGESSERQWRDVVGIVQAQSGRLDVNYLRHWAEELGVTDLLQRALEQARQ